MTGGLSHFTRQPDSTHVVIYGNGYGELLAAYWPSRSVANKWAESVERLGKSEGFAPNAHVESLAELDAIDEPDSQAND